MQFLKSTFVLFNFRLEGVISGLVILLIFLLINLGLLAAKPELFLMITPEPGGMAPTVISARLPTRTPYQPLDTTLALPASAAKLEVDAPFLVLRTPLPGLGMPNPAPSFDFYGIDFSPGAGRIKIIIQPPTDRVNGGKPIVITVNPGSSCPYPKDRACINAYSTGFATGETANGAGNVILVSVHSGIGGEAETYRRAVEGMGVDQAGFSIKQIRSYLARLEGAAVRIQQGQRAVDGLRLAATTRIPPGLMREYFHSSPEQALRLAAAVDPDLKSYTDPVGPILAFETCGWKLAGEPWAPGVTSTTGSVYLGVIEIVK